MSNIPVGNISLPPSWNGVLSGGDLAIIELPRLAPSDAQRYDIYRGNSEVGNTTTMVGYGNTGRGNAVPGQPAGHVGNSSLRWGRNRIDSATSTSVRIDLDDPQDFRGSLLEEAITAPGDSGGPAFRGFDDSIMGVSSASQFNPKQVYLMVPTETPTVMRQPLPEFPIFRAGSTAYWTIDSI